MSYEKMKKYTAGAYLSAVLLLSGCAEYRLNELACTVPKGTPFTQALTYNYAMFAKNEHAVMRDDIDASYFAGKALDAASGQEVLPESPYCWKIPAKKHGELMEARQRLMNAFERGARTVAPAEAAVAQVFYDCWLEEAEENWQDVYIATCHDGFLQKIAQVEAKLSGGVSEKSSLSERTAIYTVFFALNSTKIDHAGRVAIQEAAAEAAKHQRGIQVHVMGHTDKVGNKGTNLHLSKRRAHAVKQAMMALGVPSHDIHAKGFGAAKGHRIDAHNRRVDIICGNNGHHPPHHKEL